MTIKKALSPSLLYSGLIIVCLVAVALPAMAKGKPQKQQKQQKMEQPMKQSTTPTSPLCQPLNPTAPQPSVILPQPVSTALPQAQDSDATESGSKKAPNLRSNKGGKLRGQARAQYVHQLNQAKKQRLAGQVPNACTGLPQLPASSTTAPATTNSTTSTSQTSTSVEVNTVR